MEQRRPEKQNTEKRRSGRTGAARKREKQILVRESRVRVRVFAVLAGLLFLIGLLIPFRPEISAAENRKLAEFPKMSGSALLDGSYFTDLETWYTETYPLREGMVKFNKKWTQAYGVRTAAIYGAAAADADEIPDVDGGAAPVMTENENASAAEEPSQASAQDTDLVKAEDPPDDGSEKAADTGSPEAGDGSAGTDKTEEDGEKAGEDGGSADGEDEAPPEDDAGEQVTAPPQEFGTIYVSDGRGYSVYHFKQAGPDTYASLVNTVKQNVGDGVRVFALPVPTGFGVYLSSDVQASIGGSDFSKAYAYLLSRFDPSVITVPVLDTMISHRDEYIYFNTDHHWTALGAWYAYNEFAKAAGLTPNSYESFEKMTFDDFLGSYYEFSNQAPEIASHADTIEACVPKATNEMEFLGADNVTYTWPVINDVSGFASKSKYMCFMAGDQPMQMVHNPEKNDGSAVLIVKDSYADAFAPFLVDHYEDVYMVDHRYYTGSMYSFIKEKGIDDVIFMHQLDGMDDWSVQPIADRLFPAY